jgi:anti-sigma28 factor (negative regulator of flagellin synthesis)
MRIDDLNRAPQTQEAAKTDAVRPDAAKGHGLASGNADSDAAAISDLAMALAPSDARIEALRLQVERGEYKVSAKDVARGIIDEHILP